MIFNILIIVLALYISYSLFKKNKIIFFCLSPFLIQYIWMFVSLTVIEQGVLIDEQGRNGRFVFSNFYLLLFFLITIASFVFFFQFYYRLIDLKVYKFRFLRIEEKQWIFIVCVGVLFIGLLNIVVSPSVYDDDSITKFNYWLKSDLPFLEGILGNTIGYLPFALGIVYFFYGKRVYILIFLYLVYLYGVDQKFTAIMYGIIGFLTPYLILKAGMINTSFSLRVRKLYLIIAVIVLVSSVWLKYSVKNPYRHLNLTPIEAVAYRAFGLQGHLFWGVTNDYIHGEKTSTYDISELPYGMHVLMQEFTPPNKKKYLESVWERGVSWTNGYPAILLRIFPWPLALISHFFIFSLIPLLFVFLVKFLKYSNFFLALILFQLILWTQNAYMMSYFYRLNKVLFLLVLIILISTILNNKNNYVRK